MYRSLFACAEQVENTTSNSSISIPRNGTQSQPRHSERATYYSVYLKSMSLNYYNDAWRIISWIGYFI